MGLPLFKVQEKVMRSGREVCLLLFACTDRARKTAVAPRDLVGPVLIALGSSQAAIVSLSPRSAARVQTRKHTELHSSLFLFYVPWWLGSGVRLPCLQLICFACELCFTALCLPFLPCKAKAIVIVLYLIQLLKEIS